nr:helix-turn-helix domain-containing protein [Sphingomonas panni]
MTPTQLAVLDHVRERLTNIGHCPTVREIADHVGCGVSNAHRLIEKLVEQGALRRTADKARSLALPDRPDLRSVGSDVLHAELARRGETLEALSYGQRLAFGRVRTCAVDGCVQMVTPGHLMCRAHWWALSPELQTAIKDAHAAQNLPTYRRLVVEARDIAAHKRVA